MVEKTQNTSFGNTEENTNDEPIEQLNPEQKALLDTYLMQLDPAYAQQFEQEYRKSIEEFGVFDSVKLTAYLPLKIIYKLNMNDKLIINNQNFTINTINTNLITGKSTMELLNEL